MHSKECTRIFIIVSCFYAVRSHDSHGRRKERHSEDSIDLTLSNTIDITTEESNIWWPWASYEEWKQAHHFDVGPTSGNSPSEVKHSTTAPNSVDRAMADEAQTERRIQHKRSKKEKERRKSEEEKLKAEKQREARRKQLKEEKRRRMREEREEKRRRERQMRKRKNGGGGRNRNIVVVDDDELEDGMWTLLQSRWGDYLNNQASNECSNEIQFCKPRCLIFNRTNSYICTCPSTHELQVEKHRCKRK